MGRLQLWELEDQSWLPASLRDAMTVFQQSSIELSGPFRYLIPRLHLALQRTGDRHVVDLCSGSGGPWSDLLNGLRRAGHPVQITLTDRYPSQVHRDHLGALPEGIQFDPRSVDARAVPARLRGFRTLCNSFHHFAPEEARAILADAVRAGEGIAVFERARRDWRAFLLIPLTIPVLVAVQLVTRRSPLSHWLWALSGVLPLALLFDGYVSCLRVYNPQELRQLVASVPDGEHYDWEIGSAPDPMKLLPSTYLIGVPKAANAP